MPVWQWYKGLAPKNRIMIGFGMMAYAGMGLYLSDKAEKWLGFSPSEKDKEKLRNIFPKITTVERENR